MPQFLRRIDPLIALILSSVLLAVIFPAQGRFAELFDVATRVGIAALFFLYGARLSTREALDGLKHWRLHLTILAFTFLAFPAVGLATHALTGFLGIGLSLGLIYLTLVPSTVQASVAFTSVARGNVAGAIVSASLSNLVGVFITPLLVMALMGAGKGVHIDGSVFLHIAIQLLLPFVLGQCLRPWVKHFAANRSTKIVDRGSIAMVVYAAFSHGIVAGIWSSVGLWQLLFVVVWSVGVVAAMLWCTRWVARALGFSLEDQIAIQFCGTKKSLASGLPMAAVIFGGANLGLLILPLMVFHQVQLMMCSWLASRYAQRGSGRVSPTPPRTP